MTRKRWLLYLLINALVSALVTVSILYVYDRLYRNAAIPPSIATPLTPITPAALPSNTLQVVVLGAGKLENERVVLQYNGPLSLDLSGWRIKDEDGFVYVFPNFTLASGGAVQLHTTQGTDTPIDLFWGLPQAIWESGETLMLFDRTGTPRLNYTVP
jgi:hypothetical protein